MGARDDAFGRLGLARLISIIHPANTRLQSVARKLGMVMERRVLNPGLGQEVDVGATDRPS